MRKIILSVITVAILGFFLSKTSYASIRYTTCDACGLCPSVVNGPSSSCVVDAKQVPGDWKSCVKCIYPALYPAGSTPDPAPCSTLIVDPTTNLAKNLPKAGRQFTMLGCITSGSSVGFVGQAGAPTFVQVLLNVIFSLSGGLAFLYLMYGGFIILTSQADPEHLNYGRRLIYGSVVGLVLTLGSVFLVNLIGSGILHIPGFGGATP
jgi:hypothetical protein